MRIGIVLSLIVLLSACRNDASVNTPSGCLEDARGCTDGFECRANEAGADDCLLTESADASDEVDASSRIDPLVPNAVPDTMTQASHYRRLVKRKDLWRFGLEKGLAAASVNHQIEHFTVGHPFQNSRSLTASLPTFVPRMFPTVMRGMFDHFRI